MPAPAAYFLHSYGPLGLLLLFFVLHLMAAPFAPPKPPLLWLMVERAAEELVRRLNKSQRSRRELFIRGTLLVIVMTAFAVLIGFAVQRLALHPFGWIATLLLLMVCVSAMGPVRLLQLAARAEAPLDRVALVPLLRPLVRDSFDHADAHTVARRSLETAAVGLNLFFVMPVFWFLVGWKLGCAAPLLTVAVMLSGVAVAAESAADGTKAQPFVRMVRMVAGVFEWATAWLAGALVAFAALFVSRARPLRAFHIMATQARRFRPRRQGRLVAAMAGALGVTLGGPRRHENGHTVTHGWIGAAGTSARVPLADLQRGALMLTVVFLTVTGFLAVLAAAPAYFQ